MVLNAGHRLQQLDLGLGGPNVNVLVVGEVFHRVAQQLCVNGLQQEQQAKELRVLVAVLLAGDALVNVEQVRPLAVGLAEDAGQRLAVGCVVKRRGEGLLSLREAGMVCASKTPARSTCRADGFLSFCLPGALPARACSVNQSAFL